MPFMSVVAKFPGALLAFLALREFLFCLHCLRVWGWDLWNRARREPHAEAPLWRCRHVLPASGGPYHFLHHSVMASPELSVAWGVRPLPLLLTGWISWRLHSFACLHGSKGEEDHYGLEYRQLIPSWASGRYRKVDTTCSLKISPLLLSEDQPQPFLWLRANLSGH